MRFGWKVGIGKTSTRDTTPTVVVQSFSGGAHCCFDATAYRLSAGRVVPIELWGGDGEGLFEWPKDLDGDGIVDFEFSDGLLLYAFSSYASSFGLPAILNIVDTKAVNVSNRPQYRKELEELSAEARKACLDKEFGSDRNGGCAAYVVIAAKLGRLQPALEFTRTAAYNGPDATWPYYCATKAEPCPEGGQVKFRNFNEAITRFLREAKLAP